MAIMINRLFQCSITLARLMCQPSIFCLDCRRVVMIIQIKIQIQTQIIPGSDSFILCFDCRQVLAREGSRGVCFFAPFPNDETKIEKNNMGNNQYVKSRASREKKKVKTIDYNREWHLPNNAIDKRANKMLPSRQENALIKM